MDRINLPLKLKVLGAFVLTFMLFEGCTKSSDSPAANANQIQQTSPLVPQSPGAAHGTDDGPVDPNQVISFRIWLTPPQSQALSQLALNVINPESPQFGKWLTKAQYNAQFTQTDAEIAQVKAVYTGEGLTITSGTSRLYVSAQGTVAAVEKAFKTELHHINFQGTTFMANMSNPQIDPSLSGKILKIGGLTTHALSSHMIRQRDPLTGQTVAVTPQDAAQTPAISSQCIHPAATASFTSADKSTSSQYTGNFYGSSSMTSGQQPCGYTPQNIQTAYGMKELYAQNLDGRGETVVIIDAYGSPTAAADLGSFTTMFSLPAPQLTIYQPEGIPVPGATWNTLAQEWSGETTLDIEYVHSLAPGAKIALVETLSSSDDDLIAGIAYAIENELGNSISNSWGGVESQDDPATQALYDMILQSATVQGVSVNFSSGDNGDNFNSLGYEDVTSPSSPFMTSVGGTSLALNADNSVMFQTGWGSDLDQVASTDPVLGAAPLATVGNSKFVFGAGGGTSRHYPKPDFQKNISGAARLLPDISFLADPYTGVQILQSTFDAQGNPQAGSLKLGVIGGTSLACPLFSALWAIANQHAGKSLGLAAPLLYRLPSGAITDILPVQSKDNVQGKVLTAGQPDNDLSSLQLAGPETSVSFLSAMYDSIHIPGNWYVLTFGTDSTLTTAQGWDNVTGLGVPNGASFVNALSH